MTPARRGLRLAAGSLALGLLVEATLALVFGPVTAAGASRSFGSWLLGLLLAANSGGISAWFVRWIAAELVLAWLIHRLAMRDDGPADGLPRLAGRWLAYLATLVAVAVLVGAPAVMLLALGVSVWLVVVLAAWPLARLSVVRQAAVLSDVSALGALAASWRLTRRRELFAAFYTLLPLAPVALLWSGLYVTAAYRLVPIAAAWWVSVAAFWLYLPVVAAVWLSLWRRLMARANATEVDALLEDETEVALPEDPA